MNNEGKAIFLAGSTLFGLIEDENGIKAAANQMNVGEIEIIFNQMVNDAIADYKGFLENGYDGNPLKMSILTNFKEFFETCIDIKKTEILEMERSGIQVLPQPDPNVHAEDGGQNGPKPAKIARAMRK